MTWRHVRATGRRDGVEPGVVRAFREAGASVDLLGEPADLLVGYLGRTHLVEVKSGRAGLTPAQVAFRKRWKGEPPVTVRNAKQARRWAKRWEQDARATRIEFPRESPPVTWDEDLERRQREAAKGRTA